MEFSELQQIVESNARSIQALSDRLAELTLIQEEAQEERQELREATIKLERLSEGIVNLLGSLDEDRPTMLRKLSAIENKLDRLLDRGS